MKLYTTVRAAKILGVARDTIYRWIRDDKIRGAQITRAGKFQSPLWTDADLDRMRKWMRDHPHPNRGRRKRPGRND